MIHYILFDTETTGNSDEDRVIQVGAMIVDSKGNIEVYDELCSSDIEIKLEAMEVHNITPDLIQNKPPFIQTKFYQRLLTLNSSQNYLIAHNIQFDLGMIEKEGFESKLKIIDTLRCARHLLDLPYHRLQYLRYALDIYKDEEAEAKKHHITIKAHDAIGDVLIMKLLLSHLVKEVKSQYPKSHPMDKLVELTTTPVIVKVLKFGKHKGKEISQIASEDIGYIQWLLKNSEDEDLLYTLKQLL
jgi:exodeoxyribonuclease X